MTRDSQAVCRAARSSVTNNRFQVTLYCPLIDGPKSSLYSDSWHANTHYNAWSARIHSGGGFLLMVPVTLIKKKKTWEKINEAESFSSWCFALVSSSVTLVVVVVVVVVVRKR